MKNNAFRVALLGGLAVTLSACGGLKHTFGLDKQSPDEYQVVQSPPLVMPPDFNLRPPMSPSDKPATPDTVALAKQNVFQLDQGNKVIPVASPGNGLTAGEAALLAQAGASSPNPAIRTQVDDETAGLPAANQNFADKLLFWRSPSAPNETLDAAAEQKRLAQNAALGKPVTAGNSPTIQRTNRTIFNTLF
jgi:hypothetical protein